MGKECKVLQSSAALVFHPMFVRLLARLRAKPQHPLSMHDETELTAALITTPHIILLERKKRRINQTEGVASVIGLVVHEYRQQNNDRQRDADEPKEQSFSKSHCILR
jgi:hypothetical protein